MNDRSSRPWPVWSAAAVLGLIAFLFLLSGLRPSAASGQPAPQDGRVGAELPAPSPAPTPTPGPAAGALSTDQAIDLIFQGDFDTAERALQIQLRQASQANDSHARAELLVYLAFIASIRKQQDDARGLLREALQLSPGIKLSAVEFPSALRTLLTDVRADLIRQHPRPQRGELDDPQHVLAPVATPPGWKGGGTKLYRRWYFWAGVAAAVTVAVVVLRGDGEPNVPTATPTMTTTPTATPSEFPYEPEATFINQVCTGGDTLHLFLFPTPASGRVVVNRAVLRIVIQGDYDGIDEVTQDRINGEFVRVRVEDNPTALFAYDAPGQYCTVSEPREFSGGVLIQQIQAALEDGRIEIFLKDGPNADKHCRAQCTPSQRVSLELRYSIVP